MSGGLMSGGRMSGGRLSGGLKSYDRLQYMSFDGFTASSRCCLSGCATSKISVWLHHR